MTEQDYHDRVTALLAQISALDADPDNMGAYQIKVKRINKELVQLDNQYISEQLGAGVAIESQLLFSRHGQCSNGDKGLGMKPNAGVNPKALQQMDKTKGFTAGLLMDDTTFAEVGDSDTEAAQPLILHAHVSPLRRTLQTSERLLPPSAELYLTINVS